MRPLVQLEEPLQVARFGIEPAVGVLVNVGHVRQGGLRHAVPELVRHGIAARKGGGGDEAPDGGGTPERQRDRGVAAGAESQHIHGFHAELVQNGEDVAGGVLGGEGAAGGLGAAVALLLNRNHLALARQQRDEFAEVGADGGPAARDEEQRRLVRHRRAVDLVVHTKAVVVRVAVGEAHTAS